MRVPAVLLLAVGLALLAGICSPAAAQSTAHCYKGYCYQTDVSNIYALTEHHCAIAAQSIFFGDVTAAAAIFINGLPGNPSASYLTRVTASKPNRMLHRWVYPGYFNNYTVSSTTNFWSTTGRFVEALTFPMPYRQHRTLHTLIWDLDAKIAFDFLDDAMANPRNALRNVDRARALYAGNPAHPAAGCLDSLDNVTDNTAFMMGLAYQTNDTQWSTFGNVGLRADMSFDMTAYFNTLQRSAIHGNVRAIREGVRNIMTAYVRFGLMFIARNSYTTSFIHNCNSTIDDRGAEVAGIARQSMKDIGTLTLSLCLNLGAPRADLDRLRDAIWIHGNTSLPGGGPAYERVWPAVLRVAQYFGFTARHIGRPVPAVINAIWNDGHGCERPPVTPLI